MRDGRNIKWIRGVYNIELQKLFSLKRDFEVIKVKKVLCTEKCKMQYRIEYESSLIQKLLAKTFSLNAL